MRMCADHSIVSKYVAVLKYQKLTWAEIRCHVSNINSTLCRIIDDIDPAQPCYQVDYPYGAFIERDGYLQLPGERQQLYALHDSVVSSELRNDLGYTAGRTPLAMVLHNSVERFIDTNHHLLPWRIYQEGDFFSVEGATDDNVSTQQKTIFNITAGARNVFMLANIGDKSYHAKLCKSLDIHHANPKKLQDHWALFCKLLHSRVIHTDWHVSVLFFPKNWVMQIKSDPAWQALHNYIYRQAWQRTAYFRHKIFYDFIISQAQANRNLKPNPYLTDTAKHLLAIASRGTPGFAPAKNEKMIPTKALQQIYLEYYKLKQYTPTIMQTEYLQMKQKNSVYYSLQMPTTLEFSPKSRKVSSTVSYLLELKYVMDTVIDEILSGNLAVEKNKIEAVARSVAFDYFHTSPDSYGEISSNKLLAVVDANLLALSKNHPNNNKVPVSGSFLRGCVRLSFRDLLT